MSVLSFSVQLAGEQSSGTKPEEDILEEATLLQVDCPRQREGEKLSLAILDSKQILLEVDRARQLSNNDQFNDNNSEDDKSKELNCAPRMPVDKLSNGIHDAEKPTSKVDCYQSLQGEEQLRSKHGGCASFLETNSSLRVESNISNDTKKENCKEEAGHIRSIELHTFSCSMNNGIGSGPEQNQAQELMDTLCEPSDYTLPVKDSRGEEIDKGKETVDASYNATSIQSDASDCHGDDEDQHRILHQPLDLACKIEFEQENSFVQTQDNDLFSSSNNSDQIMRNVQSEMKSCNQEEESGLGTEYLEDHTVALWVKWRGKWQTGFQCPRVDCPLSTLRAKPTHERKKYIAIFFPRTRTYSWADMLLVRPINELPEPLASGTHRKWRKLVKDLTTPRRFIMQKLAIAMLNISDQLHTEAVVENARKATTWKDFAMEASYCRDYSDLGSMLLKLQSMVLPIFVCNDWLDSSFTSWVQRCQSAHCAESVEILTEELVTSVLWNKVDELWNPPVQHELSPEWKTWKQEVMKLFFSSHSVATGGHIEQRNSDISVGPQISRKRLKLEIRRPESCASQIQTSNCSILSQVNTVDTDSGHSICQGFRGSAPGCEPLKVESLSGVAAAMDLGTADDRWDEIAAESGSLKFIRNPDAMSADGRSGKSAVVNAPNRSDATNKYRQCLAFIEAKGRQCGRWASDGDIYCCVHLNGRSARKLPPEEQRAPVDAPMCEGMTTHGNKCKHRARYGSAFCKKHRLHRGPDPIKMDNLSTSPGNNLKRKYGENNILEKFSSSNASNSEELGLVEVENSVQENLIPIVVGETLDERNCLMKESELYNALPTPISIRGSSPDSPRCIGYYSQNNGEKCQENAKRHTLYCEKHLPKFLKRARNGKSRLISKDVFINLLRNCSSRNQKLCLHQACELLYGFMKNSLSRQKSIFKNDNLQWILSEASKDLNIGEYLLKLVSCERDKVMRLWGFSTNKDKQASCSEINAVPVLKIHEKNHDPELTVKCKICAEEFSDDQTLGAHWTDVHKKEARWLFRGYACAVCMNSFTNRKVLETHVNEKHGAQFLEHSILFRCMSCCSHFVNPEQLWQHVLSFHLIEFRLPDHTQQHYHPLDQSIQPQFESGNKVGHNNSVSEKDGSQRYMCRFCGLKFDLLPDLGRHHQVAHMNTSSISHFQSKRGDHYVKSSRHCHPRFKKSYGAAFRLKNQTSFGMQKRFQSSNTVFSLRPRLQSQASETLALGRLLESHCSDVAETLYSEIQKTKPRPSNLEILSIARSACCRISLHAALEVKYGILPENLYLKAAKLCSELNIQVGWHLEGFICPKGCKPLTNPHSLAPLKPLSDGFSEPQASPSDSMNDTEWEMEECHYILYQKHFNWKPIRRALVLCEDVSFGKEPVPVACVVDEDLNDSLKINFNEALNGEELGTLMPWQGFTYVTQRLIEPSLGLDTENSQLGCACPNSKCYPESCDHVYLFDNDYENAEDINGKPMHGRFPYDDRGQIILEEGYLVYECNSLCNCDTTCHNRVLQKGVQVKLEIFRTEKKGWAVRAGEAISRGTFVCEYIGEVLNDVEANKRGERYDSVGCSYLYDIDAHINGARGLSEGTVPYVIDATKYGNVSRFINHSCSPNLVNYQVLVESMDCQLAHIGLYASRDIAVGEELAYDYRYKLLPGEGRPCHCGAQNCRGRLY